MSPSPLQGLNPLDTLKDWVSLYGRDLDQETWMNCRAMERLLRDAMAGRGERALPGPSLWSAPCAEPEARGTEEQQEGP